MKVINVWGFGKLDPGGGQVERNQSDDRGSLCVIVS